MVDYVRLQRCLNQFNQFLSCGLTYDQFLKSAFIAAFDLTTNLQPSLAYAINTVCTGTLIFVKEKKIILKNESAYHFKKIKQFFFKYFEKEFSYGSFLKCNSIKVFSWQIKVFQKQKREG